MMPDQSLGLKSVRSRKHMYPTRARKFILSYCPHHPTASSKVFASNNPETSHHSLTLLLTLDRSPAVNSEMKEYNSTDSVRFVITTSGKRSCDGILLVGNNAGEAGIGELAIGAIPFGICLRGAIILNFTVVMVNRDWRCFWKVKIVTTRESGGLVVAVTYGASRERW